MQLYHDKPQSRGVENALKRAKQMVDLQWTPIRRIPSGMVFNAPTGKQFVDTWTPPHLPQKGVIYSSVRQHCKFVGFNVSIETYMTALSNPNSVLYTRPQHGQGRAMFSYYGIVCSAFASYVCQLSYPIVCRAWPSIPGISPVETEQLEALQLCDVVLGPTHIAVITDILRDVNGTVHRIGVSESTTPFCRFNYFTPEQFRSYWLENGYSVYRYAGIHDVTYTPNPYIHLDGDPHLEIPSVNTTFMADFGNKANYQKNECVEFSIFEDGWESVEITNPNGEKTSLSINGNKVSFSPENAGFHTATCRKQHERSQMVEFFISDLKSASLKASYSSDEKIKISFANAVPEDNVVFVQICTPDYFYRRCKLISDDERLLGCTEIENGLDAGNYVAYVVAEGAYGEYTSEFCSFSVQ